MSLRSRGRISRRRCGRIHPFRCNRLPSLRCGGIPPFRCGRLPSLRCGRIPPFRCGRLPSLRCDRIPLLRCGSITPFLCLILGLMLSLILACMHSVRMASARTQILCAADIGLYSLFGQYDRTLFNRYGILAVDSSDGNGNLALSSMYDEYNFYMLPVLAQNAQNLVVKNGGFSGIRLLTDENGEGFYAQAIAYMDKTKKSQETKWVNVSAAVKAAGVKARALKEQHILSRYHTELESALARSLEASEAEEDLLSDGSQMTAAPGTPMVVPVAAAEMILGRDDLLDLIQEKNNHPSGVHTPDSLLQRQWNTGMPLLDPLEYDDSENGKRSFINYLSIKLGCFTQPSAGGLSCQREYLLFRKNSDEENLSRMAAQLFDIRLWFNYESMQSDPAATAQINEMTEEIQRHFIVPPDGGVIGRALGFSWSCAESLADVRLMMSGEEVSLTKGSGEFYTDLSGADQAFLGEVSGFSGVSSGNGGNEEAWKYEDYLGALLFQEDRTDLIFGAMDIIEDSIRKEGYPSFRMDCCVTGAEISQDIRANGKKTFTVNRMYAYR